MEISISAQTYVFLYAVALGAILCAVYDIFRILRVVFPPNMFVALFQDVVYFIISAVICYAYILICNSGEIRWFILFGALIGWIIYYCTIGELVIRSAKAITAFLGKVIRFIFRILAWPFVTFARFTSPYTKKAVKSCKKSLKKASNLFHFYTNEYKINLVSLLRRKEH
jgi:spore cortex biosynthesis protein YabQ